MNNIYRDKSYVYNQPAYTEKKYKDSGSQSEPESNFIRYRFLSFERNAV